MIISSPFQVVDDIWLCAPKLSGLPTLASVNTIANTQMCCVLLVPVVFLFCFDSLVDSG